MEHLAGILIPLVCVPVVMSVPVFIVYLIVKAARHKRELLSRERIVALEKGVDVPLMELPDLRRRRDPLLAAMIVTALGIGLAIFFRSIVHGDGSPWGIGVTFALVGMAMMAHWFVRGREEWERERTLDEELRRAYIERLRGSGSASTTRVEPATVAD